MASDKDGPGYLLPDSGGSSQTSRTNASNCDPVVLKGTTDRAIYLGRTKTAPSPAPLPPLS